MVSFCALIYFRRLEDKQVEMNTRDLLFMYSQAKIHPKQNRSIRKFQVEEGGEIEERTESFSKKQRIKNKWLLYVTLINNHSLIIYRKKEFSHNRLMGVQFQSELND